MNYKFSLPVIALVLMSACGESQEEQDNRVALAPLVQRHFAVMTELGEWARNEKNRSDRYIDIQNKYAEWRAEEDSIAHALRRVVPTKKFACLIGILQRSVGQHGALLQSSDTYTGHLLRTNTRRDQAIEYANQGVASEYSSSYYFAQARQFLDESKEALQQSTDALLAADKAAVTDMSLADTLVTSGGPGN